jgi:hypothetical protein
VENLSQYLNSLGDLHDCTLTGISWDLAKGEAILRIEDLFWNFEGLPEYPGATPGFILLNGTTKLSADFEMQSQRSMISEVQVSDDQSAKITLTILFWEPVGRLIATCSSVVIATNEGALWPSVLPASSTED